MVSKVGGGGLGLTVSKSAAFSQRACRNENAVILIGVFLLT